MGFSRQEYWSGLPCPPPGDLPNPGIEPRSPALQADSLPSEPPGKPIQPTVKSIFQTRLFIVLKFWVNFVSFVIISATDLALLPNINFIIWFIGEVFLNFLFTFIVFEGYFPITCIIKSWLYSPWCTIHPWAYLKPSSLYLSLPHPYLAPSPVVTTSLLSTSRSLLRSLLA